MSTKEHNRSQLVALVNLIKPALATTPYIPALNHIRFDGKTATAYNDITAIQVRADIGVEACVPGLLLAAALGSFSGENVLVQEADGNTLTISSGRGKVKLPVLDVDKFPLEPISTKGGVEIELSESVLKGIDRCLFNVGTDQGHPEQMGVTLDVNEDGYAVLYSTDNTTVSRYTTKDKIKLPGGTPIVFPTFFCHQAVSLHKAYGGKAWLTVLPGALVLDFGNETDDARLFSRMVLDVEIMDFDRLFAKDVGSNDVLKKTMKMIPDNWDSALSRALLVLGTEVVKAMKATPDGDKTRLSTATSLGDAEDRIALKLDIEGRNVVLDPALLSRGSKHASMIKVNDRMTVLANDDFSFVHLVAHVQPSKE